MSKLSFLDGKNKDTTRNVVYEKKKAKPFVLSLSKD